MRSNEKHMEQLRELGVETIDVVAVNLYPFKQTIMKEGVTLAEAIENIDIGGPTMLQMCIRDRWRPECCLRTARRSWRHSLRTMRKRTVLK